MNIIGSLMIFGLWFCEVSVDTQQNISLNHFDVIWELYVNLFLYIDDIRCILEQSRDNINCFKCCMAHHSSSRLAKETCIPKL